MITDYSPLTLISKYRNPLMGLAIFGVMLGHWFSISQTQADNLFLKAIGIIPALISTQGFLFISGYGIYYSFSKNSEVIPFYKRRFYRMLLPYMLITFPYFLFRLMFEGVGIWRFLGYVTTLAYWTEGNFCGMWYVSVSVVLYLLCPLIYTLFFSRKSFVQATMCLLIMLCLAVGFNHLLYTSAYDVYERYYNGLERYFMFFIGLYCGYLSRAEKRQSQIGAVLIILMLPLAYLLKWHSPEYDYLTAAARRLVVTMPLVTVIFALLDKFRVGQPIMQVAAWLGKYSFELYIIHLITYCFLSSEVFSFGLSNRAYISIAIVVALLICAPVHKFVSILTRQQ